MARRMPSCGGTFATCHVDGFSLLARYKRAATKVSSGGSDLLEQIVHESRRAIGHAFIAGVADDTAMIDDEEARPAGDVPGLGDRAGAVFAAVPPREPVDAFRDNRLLHFFAVVIIADAQKGEGP